MSNKEKEHTRGTLFIQKSFQTGMIAKFVGLLIGMALISSVILYFLAGSELESSYYEAHSTIESVWEMLFPIVLITNFVSVFLIAIATTYVILYTSHKIAGPMHKMEKVVNDIADGNLNQTIRFRDKDQAQPLGAAIDNMIGKLSERLTNISSVKQDISSMEEKLSGNGKSVSESELSELTQLAKSAKSKLEEEFGKISLR